jgi:hypothetical protein
MNPMLPAELACTALERFFIEDGQAGSDVMGHMAFAFGRALDRALLSDSFLLICKRHPLLNARVQRSVKQKWTWVAHHETHLVFNESGFLAFFDPSGQINIEAHTGVKFLVQISDTSTIIDVRFHHAACDGLALIQFMKEWMSAYRAFCMGIDPVLAQLDPSLLRLRGASRWRSPEKVSWLQSVLSYLIQITKWSMTRSLALEPKRPMPQQVFHRDPVRDVAQPDLFALRTDGKWRFDESSATVLGPDDTAALKNMAAHQGVMLNDLILCEYYLLLSRIADDPRRPGTRLANFRISVPNSLRKRSDTSLSACNVLGFAFLDNMVGPSTSAEALLPVIAAQTRDIRKWNGGQMFLDGLALLERWPVLYQTVLRMRTCFASAVYSSVGQITGIDPDLLSVQGKPPLRRMTRVALFTSLVGDRLVITLSTDPVFFSRHQRDAMLEELCLSLRNRVKRSFHDR